MSWSGINEYLDELSFKTIMIYIAVIIIISLLYTYNYYKNYKPDIYLINSLVPGPTVFILGSVHGNEPAGTTTSYNLIREIIQKQINIKRGKVIFLPLPNPLGYKFYLRNQMKLFNSDINRNFTNNGQDRMSQLIVKISKMSDYIIDLHEGWDYHRVNKNSIGSTISIMNKFKTLSDIQLDIILKNIIKNINNKIDEDSKKFTLLYRYNDNCKPTGSLGCWSKLNNKKYILVETTGQYESQKLDIRVIQQRFIITELLKSLDII